MADNIPRPQPMQVSDDSSTNWENFRAEFEDYSLATGLNDKPAAVQAATLRRLMGAECLHVYKHSLTLTEEQRTDTKAILDALEAFFRPHKNVIYERYLFGSCMQEEGESIDAFVTRLKERAASCDYGSLRDELIRDKIVLGVAKESTRRRLLREHGLTLQLAIEICRTIELTDKRLMALERDKQTNCVNVAFKHQPAVRNRQQQQQFKQKPRNLSADNHTPSRTQIFFISIGGLAVLDELLLKLIHGSLGNNTNIKLAVVVTKTLDACIANNAAVGIHLPKYNIVPNLLKLLSYNILDSGERFSIILTLGHCTEVCEENQYALVKNNGLPLMIQALTETQDDELNKAATFVLQNCKQMTEKLSGKMNQHSFQEDERRILEVDWQNKERILEDYWNEAKQILYRIKGLENEQEESIRREILSDEDTPQETFLQAMTQHRRTNSSKQLSENSKIYLEMKCPLQNTISKVQNTSKFEKISSSREQLKSAIRNSTDASLTQNDHNNLLYGAEKMTTPNINEAYITNKNSFCDFRKGDAQASEFIFKKPDFVIKSPMQKIQRSELQYPRNPNRGMGHILTVPPKIRELRCSGCRIGRLSLNSRNFSKTLQSCQYLCEQHKIILESEMEYKRKLRRSIMANKNTSAYNGNHDDQRFSCKRSSTTTKELANFQCDAHSKNQTMKQNYSFQDQDLSENHPFEEENTEYCSIQNTETLSNRSTTTLKKRRIRKDFTSEEISYLLEGVRKMGHHWNSILWAYPFQKGRTNVDLAKKYCKLQKNGKSRNTQPR